MPTIEIMNLMGFDADGLGNHNFDRGQAYLRTTLIPLASSPTCRPTWSTRTGTTPAEWSPSTIVRVDGVTVGVDRLLERATSRV